MNKKSKNTEVIDNYKALEKNYNNLNLKLQKTNETKMFYENDCNQKGQ